MKINTYLTAILCGFTLFSTPGCKKFLDAKSDYRLKTPANLSDLQGLLDNGTIINGRSLSYGEASADNYFLTDEAYNSLRPNERDAYNWENSPYSVYYNDWAKIYDIATITNFVLEQLPSIPRTASNAAAWDNVKGSALLIRAYAFLQGAWVFAPAWDPATATSDYGIALRLTSDMNAPTTRASLQETYDRVLADCYESVPLLPPQPLHVMRPSKAAAYGMLARVHMSIRQYDSCGKYADLALQIKSDLMNYNDYALNVRKPFNRNNIEVVFDATMASQNYFCISPSYARVDPALYNSYHENDLRKIGFFASTATGYSFKGNYAQDLTTLYCGLTTDELFLMRAEARARSGQTLLALEDLNHLMENRWAAGEFIPFQAAGPAEALQLVLTERRKELIWRGLRWIDLKRLNKDGANITLTRSVEGKTYSLAPNAAGYALPLPDDIIQITGMPQNPR